MLDAFLDHTSLRLEFAPEQIQIDPRAALREFPTSPRTARAAAEEFIGASSAKLGSNLNRFPNWSWAPGRESAQRRNR